MEKVLTHSQLLLAQRGDQHPHNAVCHQQKQWCYALEPAHAHNQGGKRAAAGVDTYLSDQGQVEPRVMLKLASYASEGPWFLITVQ